MNSDLVEIKSNSVKSINIADEKERINNKVNYKTLHEY